MKMHFKVIDPLDYKERVIDLLAQLNPKKESSTIGILIDLMKESSNYNCFALFKNDDLIGISSGWTSVRIYCGKQLELDNVIIDSNIQSKGYGRYFIDAIKKWANQNKYQSIGLNTYVENSRSHKFYFNQDFQILGFHFEHNLNINR